MPLDTQGRKENFLLQETNFSHWTFPGSHRGVIILKGGMDYNVFNPGGGGFPELAWEKETLKKGGYRRENG